MGERRSSARQKSFLQGRIYFNNKRSAIDCLIRDISREGAKLILSQTATIPDVVDLYIPQKEETLRARVHWRSTGEVGVAFEAAQAPARAADGDLHARVQQLEAELAVLKRMVKKLKAEITSADSDAA